MEARRVESNEREEESSTSAVALRAACAVELRVWDGGGEGEAGARSLGHYCDAPPSLCARASLANATRAPRPCAPPDGYVSAASLLALALTSRPGTATHPLTFSLHYEFVDARLEGLPLPDDGRRARPAPEECARRLTAPGSFSSPRNALWFGRGGARRLRCVYRFDGEGSRVVLDLQAATFGREPRCATRPDPVTGRPNCVPDQIESHDGETEAEDGGPTDFDGDEDVPLRVPHLRIFESPWPGYRVSCKLFYQILLVLLDHLVINI